MPLNIIVKSGGRKKMSDEELAHYMAKRNDESAIRDSSTYKDRSRQIRKEAEKLKLPDGMKVRAVYDAKMFQAHEERNPGCMSDEGYLRELRRDNDEIKM
jgi:hypothetical protein